MSTKKSLSNSNNTLLLIVVTLVALAGLGLSTYLYKQMRTLEDYIHENIVVARPLGNSDQEQPESEATVAAENQGYVPHGRCEYYGDSQPEDYLPVYTVKTGDSLLSIAKAKFGNNSRVADIQKLNAQRYRDLDLTTKLEPGMKLYLPPKLVPAVKSMLFELSAEYIDIDSKTGEYKISLGPKILQGAAVVPDSRTIFPVGMNFQKGDCIKYLVDSGDHRTIAIYPAHYSLAILEGF